MKTIPFDIHKALAGYEVITRSGIRIPREYWHYFEVASNSRYPISYVIDGNMHSCTLTGKSTNFRDAAAPLDLFLVARAKTYYICILRDKTEGVVTTCNPKESMGEAKVWYENFSKDYELITILDFEVEDE